MKTKTKLMMSGIAIAILATTTVTGQETKKLDPEKLVGTWTLTEGKNMGVASEGESLSAVKVTMDGKTLTLDTPDGEFVMAYKIDVTNNPAHIDLEITDGPVPEGNALGIIAMSDGKLKLCYNPMGGERPTAFESTESNQNFLFVMKRKVSKFTAEKMLGEWEFVAGSRGGEDVAKERLVGGITVTKESLTMPAGPDNQFVMSYQVKVAEEGHGQIDLTIEEGPAPEGKALGIVKIEGDKMKICYDPTGENRPESFKTTQENGFFMFDLKRKAKKDGDK